MKNWLFLSNIFFFLAMTGGCPRDKQPKEVYPTLEQDTSYNAMDTLKLDSLSKEEKYHQGGGNPHEAPKPGLPDSMKLDSIKKAKGKGKGKH